MKNSKSHSEAKEQKLKKCPVCAEEIQVEAKKCKHCGEILDEDLKKEKKKSDSPVRIWDPGAAAVLSFFFPGVGQIYKGHVGMGILLLFCTGAGYLFFILPGLCLHVFAIVNAYSAPVEGARSSLSKN